MAPKLIFGVAGPAFTEAPLVACPTVGLAMGNGGATILSMATINADRGFTTQPTGNRSPPRHFRQQSKEAGRERSLRQLSVFRWRPNHSQWQMSSLSANSTNALRQRIQRMVMGIERGFVRRIPTAPHPNKHGAEDVKDLIGRLEKAVRPGSSLDRQIQIAISASLAENYTSSIDAALLLVPDGWAWSIKHDRDCASPNSDPRATVSRVNWAEKGSDEEFYQKAEGSSSATPAIALCIAALLARSLSSPVRTEKP